MAIRALVQRCSRPLPEVAGIKATQLFARNADVDAVNRRELETLPGELVSSTHNPSPCADTCSQEPWPIILMSMSKQIILSLTPLSQDPATGET